MIGYKAFDSNLCCRGMQYEVGKTYEKTNDELKLCTDSVLHFCRLIENIEKCSNYKLSECRVCEVIADGEIVTDNIKYGTKKLFILRELSREEIDEYCNTGNRNTGNRNTGDCNTGNRNTGDWNTGYCNTGDWNTGDWNTGNCNTGDCNTGNRNTGDWNTGYCNTGYRNTGDWNTGDWNTGNCNTGNRNTGDWNTGYCNTGYCNTDSPFIRMFNKDTNIKFDDINFNFPNFMFFDTTVWVSHDTATQKEKEEYKEEIECCGGFLKEIPYQEAFKISWNKASKEEHKKLFDLPNWDNEIFKKIFGIDAEAEIKKETTLDGSPCGKEI
ncbi:hypothetical protein [Methanobrevibacter sp.]|uniref:pentapeptide repeat-containing protein n=1 Tax=Methanobrevibacter sp. TaxID=66852 RepID=UPI00388EB5CC